MCIRFIWTTNEFCAYTWGPIPLYICKYSKMWKTWNLNHFRLQAFWIWYTKPVTLFIDLLKCHFLFYSFFSSFFLVILQTDFADAQVICPDSVINSYPRNHLPNEPLTINSKIRQIHRAKLKEINSKVYNHISLPFQTF